MAETGVTATAGTGSARWSRRTSLAVIGVVLAVLVVLGLASGGRDPVGAGRRVLVVGDSLTSLSKGDLQHSLESAGWTAAVDGRGGLSIGLWEPFVGPDAKFTRPDVAVVELGTNDCNLNCEPLGPAIDSIVEKLLNAGVHRILWLNVQVDSPYPVHPQYVNQELERAAVRWPQVSVVDLSSVFAGHPEWHLGDGIHFNSAGQQVYAQFVVRALVAAQKEQ